MARKARNETSARERFQRADLTKGPLSKDKFDLSSDTANERTSIAEFEAPYPFAFRESEVRLAFTTKDTFTTGGAGAQETFTVSNGLAETANTQALLVWSDEAGADYSVVQPDSIDYDADSFDYTDSGAVEELDVYYVPSDPLLIEVWKEKPGNTGAIGEMVYDDYTADLHIRDQNESAPKMTFNKSPLQPVVPRKWSVKVYSNGNYALAWKDDTNGTYASNAVMNFPVLRAGRDVDGLGRAVTQDIGNHR